MPLLLLPVPWRCPSGVRYIIAKCQCLNKANFEKVALKCQKWNLTLKKWTCGKYADISYWTSKQSPQSKNIWMKCIIHKKPNTVVTDKKMKIKNIMVPRLAMMLEHVNLLEFCVKVIQKLFNQICWFLGCNSWKECVL